MNIFITGATGFIGGSVAARMMAAGHEVRGLVRDHAQAARAAALGMRRSSAIWRTPHCWRGKRAAPMR
jgi:nucleoside-diphosphate-sugar epimerase